MIDWAPTTKPDKTFSLRLIGLGGLAKVATIHTLFTTVMARTTAPFSIHCFAAWGAGKVQASGSAINAVGMTMLLQFVVSFGFILPVNAPQNMIAYGTDTFDARDFVRTGLMITLAAFALLVIFSLTYWPWMGYMTR